jgi:ABC-type multidrug transport system fused ATPase/permease subunit
MMKPAKHFDRLNNIFFKLGWFEQSARLYKVDFDKPWYNIIFKEKYRLIFSFLFESLLGGFLTAVPVLIATSFNNQDMRLFLIIIGIWLLFSVVTIARIATVAKAEANIIYSVNTQATNFFLTTDPINHSTREMGKLIGRVKRSSDSYEGIIDFFLFNVASLVTSIVVSSYLFFQYSTTLGFIVGVSIFAFMILGVIIQYLSTQMVYPLWSKNDDAFNSISVESIAQAPFIRSLFATPIQATRLTSAGKKAASNRAYSWTVPVIGGVILRLLYTVTIAIIGLFLLDQINQGKIEAIIAVSLIVSFSSIANSLGQFSRNFGRFVDSIKRANDLFEYIREYGKTSFPSV